MRNAGSADNAENGERSAVKHAEDVTNLFEWRCRRTFANGVVGVTGVVRNRRGNRDGREQISSIVSGNCWS